MENRDRRRNQNRAPSETVVDERISQRIVGGNERDCRQVIRFGPVPGQAVARLVLRGKKE